MPRPVMKYNPAFLPPAQLVDQFVVRHGDLKTVLETVRENTTKANQHVLVIGPRGSGKTMLVRRVAAEIDRDPALRERWHPLIFSEESYDVTTPGEFWLESLFHLGQQTKDPRWRAKHKEYGAQWRDEDAMRERALGQLMAFAEERGKRLLLVVENLNALLGDQISDDDAWKLRHTLQNEPRVMLLATATSRFEEIDKANKAMYELFHVHHLRPLDRDDCRVLWHSLTGQLLEGDRVRPLQILTGGNLRLLTILSTFGARLSLHELMADLVGLVDDHTGYFKSQLDALPSIERKVYLALAELWDPSTAREVAVAARLDVNRTSSLLGRLVDRGAVATLDGQGRTKWYQVAERMYNIYYLFRHCGAPADRVRAVVRFMVSFYEPDQLIRAARRIAEEACGLEPAQRQDHYQALFYMVKQSSADSLRNQLAGVIREPFASLKDLPDDLRTVMRLPKRAASVSSAIDQLAARDDETGRSLRDAISHYTGSRLADAEKACRRAIDIEPQSCLAWALLGSFLCRQSSRLHDAKEACRKAIEIDPQFAFGWGSLGECLEESGHFDQAEQTYRKAFEIDPQYAWAWAQLGGLLHEKVSRFDEAEQAYRKAFEIDPQYAWPWAHLGQLLHEKVCRFDEAEQAYRKAIEIQPQYAWAWAKLGQLLHDKLSRFDEAEQAYSKAIEIDPQYVWPWAQLGQLLHENLSRYDEAEQAYRKAFEINPQDAWAWGHLGQLLYEKLSRYDEAEQAYRKALEIEPQVAWGWSHLGKLLHEELSRFDEAEQAYRKVIEIEPQGAWAWAQLGRLLHEKLSRFDEAEQAYRKAIEIEPQCAWTWAQLGRLLHEKLSRFDEAEQAYSKAIEIDPQYVWAWVQLGELLFRQPERREEALKFAESAVSHCPGDARLLNDFACSLGQTGEKSLLERGLAWAHEAVATAPCSGYFQHTRAAIQCALGNLDDALTSAEKYLADEKAVGNTLPDATDLFVELAARGEGTRCLQVLRESPSRNQLEPLLVGIRLFLGEDVNVAAEIKEIGYDVARRIEQRRDALGPAVVSH